MKAIIDIQRQFFLDGDEADLKPMILKDVAERTGLDISTISRVSNVKYAQTKWGTFPLKFFFTDSYTTEDGEEMSTRKIKIALHDIIEKEDKKKPISDDALAKLLKEKGFPIARRTVAKYREQHKYTIVLYFVPSKIFQKISEPKKDIIIMKTIFKTFLSSNFSWLNTLINIKNNIAIQKAFISI